MLKDSNNPGNCLTPQEIRILVLAGAGLTTKKTAARFGTKAKTVENQLGGIYIKLDVPNKTRAVVRALEMGFFDFATINFAANDAVIAD